MKKIVCSFLVLSLTACSSAPTAMNTASQDSSRVTRAPASARDDFFVLVDDDATEERAMVIRKAADKSFEVYTCKSASDFFEKTVNVGESVLPYIQSQDTRNCKLEKRFFDAAEFGHFVARLEEFGSRAGGNASKAAGGYGLAVFGYIGGVGSLFAWQSIMSDIEFGKEVGWHQLQQMSSAEKSVAKLKGGLFIVGSLTAIAVGHYLAYTGSRDAKTQEAFGFAAASINEMLRRAHPGQVPNKKVGLNTIFREFRQIDKEYANWGLPSDYVAPRK